MVKYSLAIHLLLWSLVSLYAQQAEIEFKRITELDGLSNPNVRDFLVDSNGFLWIATSDGLNRYDGHEFKVYRNQIDQSESLSDNSINALFQDSQGLLWIGTEAGLNCLDLKTDKIQRFIKDPSISGAISGDRIRHILEDKSSNLWIAFDNGAGLNKWDREAKEFTNYDLFELFPASEYGVFYQAIRDMSIDPTNEEVLWLGTTGGLLSFDMRSGQFKKHPHPMFREKNRNFSVWSIGWERENLLRVGFFGIGTDVFDTKTLSWKGSYSPPHEEIRVYDMIKKSPNEFWVAVREKGLGILNIVTDEIEFIPSAINDYKTPFPGFTASVYTHDDKLWVGGRYGVSYLDPSSNLFKLEQPYFGEKEIGKVTQVHKMDSSLFVGMSKGKEVLRIDKHKTKTIYAEKEPFYVSLMKAVKGKLYFFIRGRRMIYSYDQVSGKVTTTSILGDSSLSKGLFEVNDLVFINEEEALIATEFHGTIKVNVNQGHADVYLDADKQPLTLVANRQIEPMPDGTFWIGCPKGIAIYDKTTNSFMFSIPQYLVHEKNKRVTAVKYHPLGTFVGTTSGLIFIKDGEERLITTTNSDIQGNEIFQMAMDQQQFLWVKTRKGLSKIDPKTFEILNYDRTDGLDISGGFGCLEANTFFVCNKKGYSLFTPASLSRHRTLPETYFESFQLLGKEEPSQEINFHDPIELSHKQNLFSISFTSPSFTNPQKLRFAYKMDGVSPDWMVTQNRKINFSNLSGGTYTFYAKAMNEDRTWGPTRSLTIKIAPPYWKTWWFLILCLLAVIGVIYSYIRYRISLLKRAQEQEARELQIEALQKRLFDMNLNPYEKQPDIHKLNDVLNDPLTDREFEVLNLSIQEKTNAEIAKQLFISKSTVKFHLRNTYKKLGVGNRREALAYMNKTT